MASWESKICYACMSCFDSKGNPQTLVSFFGYTHSPLHIQPLTREQEMLIQRHRVPMVKVWDNTYRTVEPVNPAQFNIWAEQVGFRFSNEVYCLLEDKIQQPKTQPKQQPKTKPKPKQTAYNPRRRYTGSEDNTAGLWYDYD